MEIDCALSCEEHRPNDLVRNAPRAEEAGFSFAMISDHYHPWIDRQGGSPFVWSVLGGLGGQSSRSNSVTYRRGVAPLEWVSVEGMRETAARHLLTVLRSRRAPTWSF